MIPLVKKKGHFDKKKGKEKRKITSQKLNSLKKN
jgi:hypothetical protein